MFNDNNVYDNDSESFKNASNYVESDVYKHDGDIYQIQLCSNNDDIVMMLMIS